MWMELGRLIMEEYVNGSNEELIRNDWIWQGIGLRIMSMKHWMKELDFDADYEPWLGWRLGIWLNDEEMIWMNRDD